MASITTSSQGDNGKVRRKKTNIHLDMTPMVDLGFLLITFFMLTAVLTKPYVLQILKPKIDESVTEKRPPINEKNLLTLVLSENNSVYWFIGQNSPTIHRSNFSAEGIRKVLLQKKKEIKKLHVFVKATDKSRYQNLIDVLDEISITGIEHYSMMSLTPTDSRLVAEYKAPAQPVGVH
jgi:biopolymer transport protein ExbD